MRSGIDELLVASALRRLTPVRGLTAVITHNTGDVLPAADWNTYLRDNLNYLVQAGTDLASASTLAPTNEYHNVTGTTTIQNITATTTPVKGQQLRLRIVAGLTIQHNAGGTGNVFLSGGVDAALIANSIIVFVWDDVASVWREATRGGAGAGSAAVATTVAGLGGGTAGKIGRLRIMPTSYNNGGATALPAATLTVGDTTGWPTAGTVTTANGTIAFTGKTATTITGCSGGTGTLAAGAVMTVASVTTGPVDYELVDVIYDAVLGKWVSVTQPFAFNGAALFDVVPIASTWVASTQTPGRSIPAPVRWRWYDAAGLKPQVRLVGGLMGTTAAQTNGQIRVHWLSADLKDANETYTDIGADAASASNIIATVPTAAGHGQPEVVTPWSDIPAYTVKDQLFISADFFVTATAGGHIQVDHGVAMLRWVG